MKEQDFNALIGGRLKAAREENGLSQAQLAKELGYESATAVSLIESGERKVKAEDLQKAAQLLHKEIAYFVGQEGHATDIKVALRADKELTEEDKTAVLHFIELAKKRHGK
jgi:transcriptional regulator with XRE-family HTH domain